MLYYIRRKPKKETEKMHLGWISIWEIWCL